MEYALDNIIMNIVATSKDLKPTETIALAVAAVWAAFGSAMTVIFHLNKTRDKILGWLETPNRLSAQQKRFLLWWDYIPVWASVLFFISILFLALSFLAILAFIQGNILVGVVCVLGSMFGLLGLVIQITTGAKTAIMMSKHISGLYLQS